MLKFLDKVLTKAIDWLYLKRASIRLKINAHDMEGVVADAPTPEEIQAALAEFGLTVEQLSSTGALHRATDIHAMK